MITKKLNANLLKITRILSDGHFHDGDSIGKKLKMTRSAVWKAIKKLEKYGIRMDSVKGKGYAMIDSVVLLDASKIKKQLANPQIQLHVFEHLPSTNDYLQSVKATDDIHVCLAEQQTAGKGRLGRKWYSPFGKNIYFSCLYPLQKDVSELAGLSLVISLVILKTLQQFGINKNLSVKWPNDVIYDNKKLSGSLIEIKAETHGATNAIIGIGINVNMINEEKAITQPWTSMQEILQKAIDRNDLVVSLTKQLLTDLQEFTSRGFASFINEWNQKDHLMNQTISLQSLNKIIKGKAMGVNEHGHLLLQLSNNEIHAFSTGDTTILKNC